MHNVPVPNPNAADGQVIGNASFAGGLVYVDAVNGNDSTAQVGSGALPFKTLTAALTAASSGMTIWVRPGTYDEQYLLKDGVNWYFMAGSVVNVVTTNGIYDAIFADDSVTPISCVVNGFGQFNVLTGLQFQAVVSLENPNSRVYISCHSMSVNGGTGAYLVYAANTSVGNVVEVNYAYSVSGARTRLYAGGTSQIHAERVVSASTCYFVVDGGTLRVDYAEDNSSSAITNIFSFGGGNMWLDVGVFKYDLTLQCNAGNATFNLGVLTVTHDCFFNLINATNYVNCSRVNCSNTFTCQSTGGSAEDFVSIQQVTGVNVRFTLASSKAVHYKIGRAWGTAIASVRIIGSPVLSVFECDDMRAPQGSNYDTAIAPFGMIYVGNNATVKNVLIGGQYRLSGSGADSYGLTVLGTNNALKFKTGTTLVVGSGTAASSYATAAQTIGVEGDLIVNKDMDADITNLYGTVISDTDVA